MNVKLVADNVTSAVDPEPDTAVLVTLTTTLFDGALSNTTVNVPVEPPSTAVTTACETVTPTSLSLAGIVTVTSATAASPSPLLRASYSVAADAASSIASTNVTVS